MAERRPVTATEIRRDVEGYSDMTEDAFARRFYADRAELDALGIQLRVDKPAEGFSEQENYSLAPEAFHLPAIAFTDDEHAALQTAPQPARRRVRLRRAAAARAPADHLGPPEPVRLRGAELGRARHVGERRRRASSPPAWRRSTPRSRAASGSSSSTSRCSRGEVAAAPRRPVPAAVPGPPVLPRRLLARARRRARVPPLAHPRQGRLRDQGRARLPAPRRLRPARVREPHPVAARRPSGHRRDLGVGPHRLARRAQLRPATARSPTATLPHRLRDPAARDRVGARLRRARPHHRPAGARRRGARAARRDRRAPHRRAVHQRRRGHAARRRGSRGRRGARRARARRPRSAPSASPASSRSPPS